jgi:hypothetical protein
VPNRRRRRLSTATSAVAALAVASPFAVIAVSELTAGGTPAPQHHEFVQAAQITDLPNELMSALQQGLSQFGIVVPNMPSSITGPSSATTTSMPGLTTPGSLTTPGLAAPGAAAPGLTTPAGAMPAMTTPGLSVPPVTATTPSLTDPSLTNPGLTSPTATPGLTAPAAGALAGPNAALTSPIGSASGLGGAPIGDPGLAGTYPILGDPSLAAAPAASGGGGLMSDLSQAANQLGVSQGIDLLKGVLMPSIMGAIKSGAPAAAAAPAPPPPSAGG